MAISTEADKEYRRRYLATPGVRELKNKKQRLYIASKPPEERKAIARRGQLSFYGLTEETYAALVESQNNVCGICEQPNSLNRNWDIDHCHTTGVVRGLLCHHCNTMLGHAKDNIETLLKGAEYLGKFTT